MTRVLTPVVFLAGLLLAALLASITRGHRRLLVIERERALHDAHHDALTGLPNRLLFAQRIEQALVEVRRNRQRGWRCCSSTSTGSRRSTTRSVISAATSCLCRSARG